LFRSEKIINVGSLFFETPIDESGMRPGKNCVDSIFQGVLVW